MNFGLSLDLVPPFNKILYELFALLTDSGSSTRVEEKAASRICVVESEAGYKLSPPRWP